jgi:gliding motility-associated-like protein
MSVRYYLTADDAASGQNPLASPFMNTVSLQQTIFATVTNGPDCYGSLPVTLQVHVFQPAGFDDETIFLCDGQAATLSVGSGFAGYLWNDGSAAPSLSAGTPGDYTVTVTNMDGCTATKTFHVLPSGVATVDSVTVNDFAQDGNSIQVQVSGAGDYEFSLDGIRYQQSPVFEHVAPGNYQVYVRDVNGCGTTPPYPIFVLDYPRFFTPNGDGYNDVWEIKNLALRAPSAGISIFDRFGKLLYQFRAGSTGWNGKFAGRDLPSTDYWFVLTLDRERVVRGHFSLKR